VFSPIRFGDINFNDGKDYDPWQAYGQSKTANILFSRELAIRLKERAIESYSVHPGVIVTNLSRDVTKEAKEKIGLYDDKGVLDPAKVPIKTMGQGAATHIVAGFDPRISGTSASSLVRAIRLK
jgi:NAD(P)-dependent dehydrogenase (short-subunit alcohol dehydrogenase family)